MTFLAPGALAGLLLLAIPVLVHLFKPRRVRQTPFSSLRWLHLTQQRMARRIQWHQVLLFLLRVALLSLLVFSLARPLWSPSGSAARLDRIIVLDASGSMDRRVPGRPTPWETSRRTLQGFLQRLFSGDRVSLIVARRESELVMPWTTQPSLYLPQLESLQPAATATNLDEALELCRELVLERSVDADLEICILTDNQAGSLSASLASDLAREFSGQRGLRVRWYDLSLPAPRNGWLTSARLHEGPRGTSLRVEAQSVGTGEQSRSLTLSGIAGVAEATLPCALPPNQTVRLEFPLPSTFARRGSRITLKLLPADELPADDVLYVDLDQAAAPELLLVEPESVDKAGAAEGFPWRTALSALAEEGRGFDVRPIVRTPASLAADDLESADVIILADAPGFNAAQATALTRRVREGAGLLALLGPKVDAESYNRHFHDPLHPGKGLLPLPLSAAFDVPPAQGGRKRWAWRESDPLIQGLIDPLMGDLSHVSSSAWFRWEGKLPPADAVTAAHSDGSPALIARALGAGRVVLINASGDDRWCDLPRRKSFVPLVDRCVTYLAGAGGRRWFAMGEPLLVALPTAKSLHRNFTLQGTSPTGQAAVWRLDEQAIRPLARCDELFPPGFASLDRVLSVGSKPEPDSVADWPITLTINADRSESSLQPLDEASLRRCWEPADFQVQRPSSIDASPQQRDRRIDLEPWLALAACGLLLVETFFVHWLCPRISPVVRKSNRRRGFLAPLRERMESSP